MSPTELESHWNSIRGQLKQRYAQLTDDDLTFAEGKLEELLGRLQGKLGISENKLNNLLEEFSNTKSRVQRAKAKAGEIVDNVRAKAEDLAGEFKQKASEMGEQAYDQARERTRGFFEESEDYVRRNPREALISSVVAGFVVGLVISRR